jgi:transposase
LAKYKDGGIENAINDAPGRGRNPEITDDEKAWIHNIACKKPSEFGYPAETWTISKITKHIIENAEMSGYTRLSTISRSKIQVILNDADIKPHRIRYYCEKRDADFDEKMHDVLVVYKQVSMMFAEDGKLLPFDGDIVHTISYDEKPGIQAISNTSPDKKPIIGNGTTMRDYEYIRKGTMSLLAGIDLLTGEAIPLVRETHKSSDFIDFLRILDRKYPEGEKIRLILDNHSSHISKETRAYLQAVAGRFEFIFTPKHGSWLNVAESELGSMALQALGGQRINSIDLLNEILAAWHSDRNSRQKGVNWQFTADDARIKLHRLYPKPIFPN